MKCLNKVVLAGYLFSSVNFIIAAIYVCRRVYNPGINDISRIFGSIAFISLAITVIISYIMKLNKKKTID